LNKYKEYEKLKQLIRDTAKSPMDYETKVRKLAKELGV